MDMKELNCLKEMLCDEVRKINNQGELNPTSLQIADMVVDIIKDITEINEKEMMSGYGDDGSYRNNGSYNRGYYIEPRYQNESPYMGSYNRGGMNMRGGMNSYDNSYSRHTATDQMISKLEAMKQDASSQDKNAIQRCIDELKNQ